MEISSVNSVSATNQVQGSQAVNSAPEVATVEKTTPVVTISENTGRANDSQNGKNEEYTPSNEAVKKAVEVINKKLGDSRAVFGVHEDTNRITIKMVSKDSKEVLKEYPVEETLDALAKLWDMAGVMVDEKR